MIADLDPEQDEPVFVCGAHRSRSTFLQRLLNTHPQLVIWGEHGGFINKLVELDQISEIYRGGRDDMTPDQISMFASKRVEVMFDYNPWTNPLQRQDYHDLCRQTLSSAFRRGLDAGQRWGFKEIRYNAPATMAFLARLYPRAQFILLRRDLTELCVSNILVDWSVHHLAEMDAATTLEGAFEVLADCAYGLCALEAQSRQSALALGPRALLIEDGELVETTEHIFRFLGLDTPDHHAEAMRLNARMRLGETRKDLSVGLLTQGFIEDHAPNFIEAAREEIDAQGIDFPRLRRQAQTGRYSFLVGDHELRHTHLSSLF